jgi:hypothetical protein
MSKRRILLIQENVQSARSMKRLLEEAGYSVDWRPEVTASFLRSGALADSIL